MMRSNLYRAVLPVLAVGSLALLVRPAAGSLLVSDGFNYPAGGSLSGNSGWTLQGSTGGDPTLATGSLTFANTPTNYPGNLAGGDVVQIGTHGANDSISLGSDYDDTNNVNSSLFYSLTMTVGTAGTALSGLQVVTSNGVFFAGLGDSAATASSTLPTKDMFGLLCIAATDTTRNNFYLGVAQNKAAPGSPVYDESDSYAAGDTLFVVLEYDFNASGDTSEIYVYDGNSTGVTIPQTYPGLAAATESSPFDAAISSSDTGEIESFLLRDNSVSSGQISVDNVRVGTSWADVAVPEPASLGLVALGGLIGLRRRRRVG